MMNRACITINFFPIAGGARSIAYEVWRALRTDSEVHFLTIPPHTYSKQYIIHALQKSRRHYLPFNPGLFPFCIGYTIWGSLNLLYLNKQYQFSIILAQDGVFTGLYSVIVGKLIGTKVVVMDYGATTNFLSDEYWNFKNVLRGARHTIVDLHTLLLRATARIAIKKTAKWADRLGVLGYELEKIYGGMTIPKAKIRTIQYGVDENFYKPDADKKNLGRKRLGLSDEDIVVNATCRLSQEKGIEYLLPAMKQSVEKNNRVVCLLVGAGNMFNYAAGLVKQNRLENRIRLMGEATPEQVRELLQISDIFVYAGVSGSNISLAVLEAMATGLAAVATDSPKSHVDLLANNRGIAVPTKDTTALTQAIITLAENEKGRKEIAENGRKWVLAHNASEATKKSIEVLVRT